MSTLPPIKTDPSREHPVVTTMTAEPVSHRPYRPHDPVQTATLGGRIRHWRLDRGLTQESLARSAEVSKSFISLIETDRSVPSIFTVQLIADTLQLRLDYLIAGRGEVER